MLVAPAEMIGKRRALLGRLTSAPGSRATGQMSAFRLDGARLIHLRLFSNTPLTSTEAGPPILFRSLVPLETPKASWPTRLAGTRSRACRTCKRYAPCWRIELWKLLLAGRVIGGIPSTGDKGLIRDGKICLLWFAVLHLPLGNTREASKLALSGRGGLVLVQSLVGGREDPLRFPRVPP